MKKLCFTICFLFLFIAVYAQRDRLYTSNQGLSNYSFSSFLQDKNGFVWVGTDGGLNKFDGYSFEVYQNVLEDTNSLNNNMVSSIFEDSKGRLWVGTMSGLQIFNSKLNNFTNFHFNYKGKRIPASALSLLEDREGNIWVGSSHGLIKINPATNKQTFYNPLETENDSLAVDRQQVIMQDDKGNIWIGTDGNGLQVYNPSKKLLTHYRKRNSKNSLCDNTILSLCKDRKGNIIIGTLKGGISIFVHAENRFINIPFSNDPNNQFNGGVHSIVEDKQGTVWVGTERNGLKILDINSYTLLDANQNIDLENNKDTKIHCFEDRDANLWIGIHYKGIYLKKANLKAFYNFKKHASPDYNSISNNIVKAIVKDSYDNLWVGTDGGGLNYLPANDNKFKLYKHISNQRSSLSDNAVISLCEDLQHNIWVGTYLGGLSLYNRNSQTFTNYLIDSTRDGKNYNFVSSLITDPKGNLWVGTHGGSLYYFDTNKRTFKSFQKIKVNNQHITLNIDITALFLDKKGTLWIGTYDGVFFWNQSKDIFGSYTIHNKKIKSEVIYTIYEDTDSNIWLGTNNGLYKLDARTEEIKIYTTSHGLCSNTIYGILEDEHGNLWISTINGLSKFQKQNEVFRNYFSHDGLPGNEFRPNSCFKAKNNMLYFGGTSGLVYFHPNSIQQNLTKPTLVFSKLKVFNEMVSVGEYQGHVILEKVINETSKINLRHEDNSFTLEFAAVDYTAPEKIKYAYMMEGFDKNWNIKDYNQRYATYTNLNPGSYTFKLKSTNSDGVWNENLRTISIIIAPPFWKTWWAFIIYFVIIFMILVYSRKLLVFRLQMQSELHLERMEREKLEEINQSKLQFFTNASHEFRTPLSLIISPVEKLLNTDVEPAVRKQITLIHKNSLRLLRLVNQILELQKIEKNQMNLKAQEGDIVAFVKEIISLFEEWASGKKITLGFESEVEELKVWFDPDKFDKILFNLLSNALKFTPEGGSITVLISTASDYSINTPLSKYVEITVSDTGKGISKEHIDKIFERFYQIENKDSNLQLGTGIGLHLSKSLVELHSGVILVKSEKGYGSRFTVRLPLGNAHLNKDQVTTNITSPTLPFPSPLITDVYEPFDIAGNQQLDNTNSTFYKILIIDDDFDIRNYLSLELSSDYNILEASHGKEGLLIAQEQLPDLIISDVMMPEMDGIELCKLLKTDIHTCHIPVILLTARDSDDQRIEGLETGADSYIPKPFHLKHLKIRIEKLIELRESLKQKFSKTVSFNVKEMTVMSGDEKFLQKAIDYVKENISDTSFNIEDMGKELGMSRVHLYRKIKSLTDQSPSEFVRTIRLKQAAYLLAQNKINISEVAYKVGFNSPHYFSNCFHDYFNMSPTDYVQNCKEGKIKH